MQRGRFFFFLVLCPDWSTLLPGFLAKRENNQEASALCVSSSNKWLQNSPAKSVKKNYFSLKWVSPLRFHVYLKELCTAQWDADVMWQNIRLCIKQGREKGTGTLGRVCENFGTWERETKDLGTSSMGRGDLWDGDGGRQIRGRGDVKYWDAGMWMIIAKVGGKCDISYFPPEYVLVNTTHPALLTKQRLGEDPLHWRKWNCCPGLLADGILDP